MSRSYLIFFSDGNSMRDNMEVCFEQPVSANNIECAKVSITKEPEVIPVDSVSTMQKPVEVAAKVDPSGGILLSHCMMTLIAFFLYLLFDKHLLNMYYYGLIYTGLFTVKHRFEHNHFVECK